MKPYKIKSPYFKDVICIVPDQEAYEIAIERYDIIKKKMPTFSEKELVFISENVNMKSKAGKAEILAMEKLKKLFHASIHGIPEDYDHHAVVLDRLTSEKKNYYLAARKERKKTAMEKMRFAATG